MRLGEFNNIYIFKQLSFLIIILPIYLIKYKKMKYKQCLLFMTSLW